jgi:uncharacterized protein DUF992
MHRLLLAAFAVLSAGTTNAQVPRTALGTLTCTLAESGEKRSMPQSEERAMRCAFKPTESGAEHVYTGKIRQVGTGQELQGKLVLIWAVMGPADTKLTPGLIAQTYVGGTADTPAKGAAAKGLVGERDKEIVMQPETPQGSADGPPTIMVIELKLESLPA